MATVTQTVREVADFVEREPRNSVDFFVRDTAELGERTLVRPSATERDIALLNDAITSAAWPAPRDGALLNDYVHTSVLRTRLLKEVARLRDRTAGGVRVYENVLETAEANDSATNDVSLILRDSGFLNDIVTRATYGSRTILERARLRDYANRGASGLTVRDTAELNDVITSSHRERAVLRDVAYLNDILTAPVRNTEVVRETATFDEILSSTTVGGPVTLREVAYLADEAFPPVYGRAYTCSIVTWGMSTFSNFPFKTMAGGFASGDNLWRLDADTDYGSPIESHILTGVTDLGASQLKRVTALYFAGKADAPLTVSVIADVAGQKQSYDYELELRDQDDYRNNRTLVGKGFRSRFAQFRVSASAVKYRILAAEADVSVSMRRI